MDNEQTEQNPAELIKKAANELIKIPIGDKKHGEVVKKYYKQISAIFRNIVLETENADTQHELKKLKAGFLEVLESIGATETINSQYSGQHDNVVRYRSHHLDFKKLNHLERKLEDILEEVKHQKKPDGDENNNTTPEQIESQESEEPLEPEQGKLRRICRLLKKIPHWIYVLIIFLAALLTIFHYLGWLR